MSGYFEILAHEETSLGVLCLRRRELLGRPGTFATEITLNHEFLMSSYNTASERALADCALEFLGGDSNDVRVLVGGLGLGYTAWQVLQSSRVANVEVIEFLAPVIRWLEEGLIPLSEELRGESRLHITQGDVYAMLVGAPSETYDLILIDVDHSPDERLDLHDRDSGPGAFYTEAGLRRAKAHLAPGGVLAVWSYDESSPFVDALRSVFDEVRVERVEFENDLIDETSTDLLFLAKDRVG